MIERLRLLRGYHATRAQSGAHRRTSRVAAAKRRSFLSVTSPTDNPYLSAASRDFAMMRRMLPHTL